MRVQTSIFCGLVFLALAGCGSSSNSGNGSPNPLPVQGLLTPVTDPAVLEASIKSGLAGMASTEQLAGADAAANASAGAGNYTGTYTQELNVDELDAVRYDGGHLYVAPRRYFQCCFVLADAAPEEAKTIAERSIRILATDPVNGSANVVSSIPLADGVSVQGMYVDADRLFALTGGSIFGHYGELWADVAIWAPEKLGFQIYDTSDKANPQLEVEATIDGVFVESRRIGNTVYLVSRYTPWLEGLHYYVQTAEQQAENEALLAGATLDDLLPTITIGAEKFSLVDPEQCYVTTDEENAYAVVTSVTAIPMDNPLGFSTTCYNESTYGLYVSENALYVAESRPDSAAAVDVTRIHKFALAATDVSYKGSADIEGTVWRGGQADFRMSEYNGDLRLLASIWDWNSDDFVDHQLYILRESGTDPALDIVSTLPNSSRPDEIGKPNEALYGVRFLGDVAYAITFEQIDPLYAIDLADPADPFIAGELEVTGFSDFLHPVNDDLLLGLGRSAEGGIKLELFDVSDITAPLSRGGATIGGRGSYSEALYDRHAFTYQADAGDVDRLAIPAQVYAEDGSWTFLGASLYLFEIHDKDMPSMASLISVGAIDPPSLDPNVPDWIDRSRAFIHDDAVFYIRDEEVWAAFWEAPGAVNGPF